MDVRDANYRAVRQPYRPLRQTKTNRHHLMTSRYGHAEAKTEYDAVAAACDAVIG